MPSLDVTLTMLTHISTLPSLHTLRLCNRFGHGRFHDFPVELIKMVEGYIAQPVRERVAKNLAIASRCRGGNAHFEDLRGNDHIIQSSCGENGFGMAVELCRQLSEEELSKSTKASRVLKPDIFVYPSQTHSPALGLGSSDEAGEPDASDSQGSESTDDSDGEHDSTSDGSSDSDDKTTMYSFPRFMVLTRNKEGGEN